MRHRTIARRTITRHLTDRCRIVDAPDSVGSLNESTFEVTFPAGAVIYEGPCKIHDRQSQRQRFEGHEDLQVGEVGLKLPGTWTAGLLRVGQIVTMLDTDALDLADDCVEFEIIRVPVRSHFLTHRAVMTRAVSTPTVGGI